ncbi:hypothetical protein X975_17613, partial [Stegodyphus mimosarum]
MKTKRKQLCYLRSNAKIIVSSKLFMNLNLYSPLISKVSFISLLLLMIIRDT